MPEPDWHVHNPLYTPTDTLSTLQASPLQMYTSCSSVAAIARATEARSQAPLYRCLERRQVVLHVANTRVNAREHTANTRIGRIRRLHDVRMSCFYCGVSNNYLHELGGFLVEGILGVWLEEEEEEAIDYGTDVQHLVECAIVLSPSQLARDCACVR